MDNMNTIKEMYRQNEPGAFDEELVKCFAALPELNINEAFSNINIKYDEKKLNDLKESLNEMRKCKNQILIVGAHFKNDINSLLKALALEKNVGIITIYNDSKEEIGYKFHFDETAAAANVINIESSKEIDEVIFIPGVNAVSVPKEPAEVIIPFELRTIEPLRVAYIPDLKQTRKERKQQYNNNHRKNWRKRK